MFVTVVHSKSKFFNNNTIYDGTLKYVSNLLFTKINLINVITAFEDSLKLMVCLRANQFYTYIPVEHFPYIQ